MCGSYLNYSTVPGWNDEYMLWPLNTDELMHKDKGT